MPQNSPTFQDSVVEVEADMMLLRANKLTAEVQWKELQAKLVEGKAQLTELENKLALTRQLNNSAEALLTRYEADAASQKKISEELQTKIRSMKRVIRTYEERVKSDEARQVEVRATLKRNVERNAQLEAVMLRNTELLEQQEAKLKEVTAKVASMSKLNILHLNRLLLFLSYYFDRLLFL